MTDPPHARPLRRRDLDDDPLRQFTTWYEAAAAFGVTRPEAAALGTATRAGRPSVRFVLLKEADERGFCFYSGYESRKGHELETNPWGALCFYWHELGRQVRVEGAVIRVPEADSDRYFATRPRGAQLSAAASCQGTVVASRRQLEAAVEELASRHRQGTVPRPQFWGGYMLSPELYEFWQHREDRLHDRFRYSHADGGWTIERLSP